MKHPAIPEESCNFVAAKSNNKSAEWADIHSMSIELRAEIPGDMKENYLFWRNKEMRV